MVGLQETLKALSDPVRRDILNILKNGRLSAGESPSILIYRRRRFRII